MKNSIENKVAINKIYDLNMKTLIAFIRRNTINPKTKNQNKILKNHEIEIIHQFIRFLLLHNIRFIHEIVFSIYFEFKTCS